VNFIPSLGSRFRLPTAVQGGTESLKGCLKMGDGRILLKTSAPLSLIKTFLMNLISAARQRQNTEISKQIFPEKVYRGLSPNFHFHAPVSDLYIPTIGLPILLEEICRPILGLHKSLTDT
jgi:hypothetical protein